MEELIKITESNGKKAVNARDLHEFLESKQDFSTWIKNLAPVITTEEETISLKEYKALQKKMKDLEIENEILKKATAIFAKNQ